MSVALLESPLSRSCSLQPWYAKKAEHLSDEPLVSEEVSKGTTLALTAAVPESQEGREGKKEKGKRKDKDKKKDKEKKKDKHKKLRSDSSSGKPKNVEGVDPFAILRAEREAREALERKRANQAVLDATFNADG